jgi:hypothetical protein
MRRLRDWIGAVVAAIVTYRLWKKWRQPAPVPATAPVAEETDDRAEELRAKLAETRASDEPEAVEPTERPEESADSVDERRRRVHEEGRAAIDRMNDGEQQ